MKIAHIYDEHDPVSADGGSVSKVVYNLAKTQSDLGHEVTVIERQWSDFAHQEQQKGIQYQRIPLHFGSDTPWEEIPYQQIRNLSGILTLCSSRLEFALKLRNHFKQTDYDIIHFHVPFAANILIHIYPEIREKLVYTAHVGEEDVRFGLSKEGFTSYLLSKFSPDLHLMRRSATSNVLNKKLVEKLPIDNLKSIPNGVDVTEYTPKNAELVDLKSKFGIETPFVLFVGTITPRKGPDILLEAITNLEKNDGVGDFSFVFAGKQNIEEKFATQLIDRSQNVPSNIHFPGFVSLKELKTLYAASDIFTLPSHEEGMPMVVTEAMASGTPIIASDVSGIPEQVEEGVNGHLVEPDRPAELANKIQSLISNEDIRERMSLRSREKAVKKFSWQSVTQKYLDLYPSD